MATARVPLTSPAHLPAGRRHLFMAGLLIALAAFVATFLLGSFMVLRSQQILGGVSVVVAARDIQPREGLNASSVELTNFPSNLVPSGALGSMEAANGKFAVRAISKGEVVTSAMVSAQPVEGAAVTQGYLPIPAGYVAFTIPTSELEGVGGYVAPGDYIDVIATVNTGIFGAATPKTVTKTIFSNLYVMRVGPQTGTAEGAAGGVSSSLTVIVNSCDAEMWSWLLGNATLRYELRSYKNYPSPSPSPAAAAANGASAGAASTGTTGSGQPSGTTTTTSANACPLGGTSGIGPAQVDARFGFTKV